jgi:hypothetical protein
VPRGQLAIWSGAKGWETTTSGGMCSAQSHSCTAHKVHHQSAKAPPEDDVGHHAVLLLARVEAVGLRDKAQAGRASSAPVIEAAMARWHLPRRRCLVHSTRQAVVAVQQARLFLSSDRPSRAQRPGLRQRRREAAAHETWRQHPDTLIHITRHSQAQPTHASTGAGTHRCYRRQQTAAPPSLLRQHPPTVISAGTYTSVALGCALSRSLHRLTPTTPVPHPMPPRWYDWMSGLILKWFTCA